MTQDVVSPKAAQMILGYKLGQEPLTGAQRAVTASAMSEVVDVEIFFPPFAISGSLWRPMPLRLLSHL